MFKTRFGWAILLLGLGLLGASWIAYSQDPTSLAIDEGDQTEAPIVGYFAPDFTLGTTIGEEVNLSDYRGRPVVLNFWASWCPPCRAEMPHFQQASVKYHGQATILGIDQGEPLSVVADFGSAMGISYPLLVDSANIVNHQYNVAALPTTVFIDSGGIIREVFTGIVNQAVLQDRIERLLAEG